MKVSKTLVFDYLMGNDLGDYDIEELENDPKFMAEVVKNDKNSYNLCSDQVKQDYEFTKKIIEKYKDDIPFVDKVAQSFLDSYDEEDEEQCENAYVINLLMRDIVSDLEDEDPLKTKYYLLTNISISWDQISAEMLKQELGEKYENKVGTGFILQQGFHCNKIVLDFIADNYLVDIFTNAINLEDNLHNLYKSFKEFEEAGKYKVLSNMVAYYDKSLAEYALVNLESFRNINMELKRINDNWVYYEDMKAKAKEEMYQEILEKSFSCINNEDPYEQKKEILFVAKKFGLENEIEKLLNEMVVLLDDIVSSYKINYATDEEFEDYLKGLRETKKMNNNFDSILDDFDDNHDSYDIEDINNIQKVFEEVLGYKLEPKQGKTKGKKLKFKIIPFYTDNDKEDE